MSHNGRYVGDGYVGGVPLVPAPTSLGAIAAAVGAFPDFHVQGNVAKDLVTNTNLVVNGTAAANFATTRLIDSSPKLPMVTGVLNFPAAVDAWRAWNNTVNEAGASSELMAATWRVRTIPATRNIIGKRNVATAGYEMALTSDSKAQFNVQVSGQVAVTVELIGPFSPLVWHTTVCVIDRVNNRIGIGSTDEAELEAGNEAFAPIAAGTIANTSTYAIGAQRLQAIDGTVLSVTHWRGAKVDAMLARSYGPKLISRDIAALSWWDEAKTRIT